MLMEGSIERDEAAVNPERKGDTEPGGVSRSQRCDAVDANSSFQEF